MRFETLESRTVFDQSLGAALEFAIDTSADVGDDFPTVPQDVQFRSTSDDFRYESASLDPTVLDEFVGATEQWSDDPIPWRTFKLSDTDAWRKSIKTNPVSIHEDGYVIAERVASQYDPHTHLTVQKPQSDDFLHGGLFMRPDHHYRFSFDVRHPDTEKTWLENEEGNWAIVTQLWGPREDGETILEPPFSIYTLVRNGEPEWVIRNIGDEARITTPGNVDFYEVSRIPMTNIGEWQHFDIEYVPNSEGHGLVRTWLNGELVFEWIDVKSSYTAVWGGTPTGPMNPSFGMYSYSVADGQEAHFDNMILQSNGEFQSSIAGRVTGSGDFGGTAVYATNTETGEKFGTYTEKNGVYVLPVPKGNYTVTAIKEDTGQTGSVENVSTLDATSRLTDIEVDAPKKKIIRQEEMTLAGDVNGDGIEDVINRLADGSWQVSILGTNGNTAQDVNGQIRADRSINETTPEEIDTRVWSRWTNSIEWSDIQVADFNGDGLDDIAGRATEKGTWWIAESTGTGFVNRYWGKWTPGIDWINVNVGDFNGDGLADIAGRAATNGTWWISMSEGDGFDNSPWGRWTLAIDWEMMVGDFNGDGMDDIAGRAGSDGTIWVGESNGTRFVNSYWGRFTKKVDWSEFIVGDFNGDGKSDLAARAASDGSFWIAESQGDRFANSYWGRWKNTIEWLDISVTDVDGDGDSDLVGRAGSDGSWWVAKSNGGRFQNQFWGAVWHQDEDWLGAVVGDFDGDGTADLLGENSDTWWLSL